MSCHQEIVHRTFEATLSQYIVSHNRNRRYSVVCLHLFQLYTQYGSSYLSLASCYNATTQASRYAYRLIETCKLNNTVISHDHNACSHDTAFINRK